MHFNIEQTTWLAGNALTRRGAISPLAMVCILAFVLIGSFATLIYSGAGEFSVDSVDLNVVEKLSSSPKKEYSLTIRKPVGPPRVPTGQIDVHGRAITVACSTCHSTRPPNLDNQSADHMDEFHSKLKFAHGSISCLSCHNSEDYDALKLADGQRIEFSNVMTLCAQCHGQQATEYKNGVHGGMTGSWDLTRGPQEKNNCVDCHQPHNPGFPKMIPTFKPEDRFLDKSEGHQ